ncbi:MAG: 30S ribosomal protein S20 [Candidatus Peregrinibacteria bacterium GW2011_GWA2_44_7]|nr:MAG: 30S ribosomal protein S20 [Candidatus Peregrinibacteria bacterium GW2011_GWA2_44_7]
MPIIKSAIKAARQSEKRRQRLQPFNTRMKTMIKKIIVLSKAGKKEEAKKLLPEVYKAIDTACKKNIIHPNNASRKKSSAARLALA